MYFGYKKCQDKPLTLHGCLDIPEELKFYISLDENRKPCEIQKRYNVNKILQCYDTLYSLSAAVDEIRKEFIF